NQGGGIAGLDDKSADEAALRNPGFQLLEQVGRGQGQDGGGDGALPVPAAGGQADARDGPQAGGGGEPADGEPGAHDGAGAEETDARDHLGGDAGGVGLPRAELGHV